MAREKGVALLLTGEPKREPSDDESEDTTEEESEGDEEAMKEAAAQDLINAIKKNDAKGVKAAIQSFYDACSMMEE